MFENIKPGDKVFAFITSRIPTGSHLQGEVEILDRFEKERVPLLHFQLEMVNDKNDFCIHPDGRIQRNMGIHPLIDTNNLWMACGQAFYSRIDYNDCKEVAEALAALKPNHYLHLIDKFPPMPSEKRHRILDLVKEIELLIGEKSCKNCSHRSDLAGTEECRIINQQTAEDDFCDEWEEKIQ